MNDKDLKKFAAEIRLETVKCVASRGFGHLGGALSIVDTLAVLYGGAMKYDPKNPQWDKRDLLVCSKGHAGPAIYATLALKGFFPIEELATLNQPGTSLPSHCDRNKTPGIDMTTGSLGQGIGLATGMAMGVQGSGRNVFAIIGDGESDEGQVWEAAEFAAHYKLDDLTLFVDCNKKQLDGFCKDVMDPRDLGDKFTAFGWNVIRVKGNDTAEVSAAVEKAKAFKGQPTAIILDTVKGAGVPDVENAASNHHMKLKPEAFDKMIAYLEEQLAELKA